MRGGDAFDYAEYLSENPSNDELDIIEESPKTETAISETLTTVSEKELSNPIIAQYSEKSTSKGQFSLKENSSESKNPNSCTKAEAVEMVDGIMENLLSFEWGAPEMFAPAYSITIICTLAIVTLAQEVCFGAKGEDILQ